jgi:hypothetical protein
MDVIIIPNTTMTDPTHSIGRKYPLSNRTPVATPTTRRRNACVLPIQEMDEGDSLSKWVS